MRILTWDTLSPTERFAKTRQILIELAQALDYIHQLGWVHRDITPGNIMIHPDGSIKLMDFGIVKFLGNELTAVGEMIGTVAYMSPEQIKGDQIDARADLYSFGTCLYFMLTGKRPFSARTLPGYLDKHLNHKPTPPQHHTPMVPQDLAFCLYASFGKRSQRSVLLCQPSFVLLGSHRTIFDESTRRSNMGTFLTEMISHIWKRTKAVWLLSKAPMVWAAPHFKEASRLVEKSRLSLHLHQQSISFPSSFLRGPNTLSTTGTCDTK